MSLYFDIFGLKIPAYGLSIAVGMIAIMIFLKYQKIYPEVDFDTGLDMMIKTIVLGGIGAKVLYWITDPDSFLILFDSSYTLMERFKVAFQGGLVFLGGLIGGGVGLYFIMKKYKHLRTLKVLDLFGICMPILQMFGRVGCFFAGCCYGMVCDSPISVVFPDTGFAPAGVPLLPTQLFGVVGNAIIVITLLLFNKKERKDGKTLGLYLLMYSIGRFIFEFFRGDEYRGIFAGLSTSQWLSIPLLVLGIYLFFIRKDKISKDELEEVIEEDTLN